MTTWAEVRSRARKQLTAGGVEHATAEARWMVEGVSGYEGGELVAAERERAPEVAAARVQAMVERRIAGEPLQYVLGEWSFCGLEVMVDRRVLVPRPETETTAGVAIEEMTRLGARVGRHDPWTGTRTELAVADLGTGSGVLALGLAAAFPDVEVWATDVDEDAIAVARANLAGAGSLAARIRLVRGSWFDALPEELRGGLRLVVSNPPYVGESEVPSLPREVRDHEPRGALVAGPTGFEAIGEIVGGARAWLEPAGVLVVELAPRLAESAVRSAREAGFDDVLVRQDLTGRDRVLVARASG